MKWTDWGLLLQLGIDWRPGGVNLSVPVHHPLDWPMAIAYTAIALAAFAATRARPSYVIAALVLTAPFALASYVGATTITLLKVAVFGTAFGLVTVKPRLEAFRTRPVQLILAAFAALFGATLLSAISAADRGAVAREAGKLLEYVMIFGVSLLAYATDPDDRPFWRSLKLVTLLVCLSALAQYLIGAHSGIVLGGRPVPRIAGALEGPNQLSGYLGTIIPILFARTLLHRDRTLSFLLGVAVVVDVLTLSRSGVFAAVVGCVVVLSQLRLRRVVAIRFALVTFVLISVTAIAVSSQGAPAGYLSLSEQVQPGEHLGNRSLLWHAATQLWLRSPIIGVGAGNYETSLPSVGLPDVRTHANSLYLQALAETGVLGLAATVALFVAVSTSLWRSALRRPLIVGAIGATSALALHQIFDDMFFFPKVASMFWLTVGVAVAEVAAQRLAEARRRTALG